MNMNWAEMMNQFQGQGSIFWVAAASIAGGATLLLISGLVLAKRGVVKGSRGPGGRIKGALKTWRKPRPAVVLTETGYQANTLTKTIPAAAAKGQPDDSTLADLYSRLKTAANSLEVIHQSLKNGDQMQGVSRLKAPLRDVEYVFKSGVS